MPASRRDKPLTLPDGPLHTAPAQGLRIGVVLGAGGPVGHAYHAGVLRALSERTGWEPRTADLLVGTSAGSQIAALLRAGMPARDLAARITGEAMSEAGQHIATHMVRPELHQPEDAALDAARRRYRPGSPSYLWQAARRPWLVRPGRLAAALLPRGRVSMMPQISGLRRLFGTAWPEAPLWITAVQMRTGQPVAFGHPSAPVTDVGSAVSSSSAVPGMREPVLIDGEHYVDGGMASPLHLDLVLENDLELDLVLVSSPLSMYPPMRLLLRREMRPLIARGVRVIAFEPNDQAAMAMGWNCMDPARAAYVARTARASTRAALELDPVLRELADELRDLATRQQTADAALRTA